MKMDVITDCAWLLQVAVLALSWVIVGEEQQLSAKQILYDVKVFLIDFLILYMVGSVCMVLCKGGWFSIIWNLIVGFVGILSLKKWSNYRKYAFLTVWCAMFAGVICLMELSGKAALLVEVNVECQWMAELVRLMCYVLMIPIAFFLRSMKMSRFESIPGCGVALIMVGSGAMLIFRITSHLIPYVESETYWIISDQTMTYVIILVFMLMTVYVMYFMCRERTDILSLQAEKQRYLGEQQMIGLVEQNLKDLRSIRHELKNQYGYMKILIEQEQYGALKEYFKKISNQIPESLSYVDCGNRCINTILNMEISKAKAAQIEVQHQFMVPPVLSFSDEDLCSLIANIMDNAIEECSDMKKKGRDCRINLEIYQKESYLFLRCTNPTNRTDLKRNGKGLHTTKKDSLLHGHGTQIISRIAEKYNGMAEYCLKEGVFIVTVIIDMMAAMEENQR